MKKLFSFLGFMCIVIVLSAQVRPTRLYFIPSASSPKKVKPVADAGHHARLSPGSAIMLDFEGVTGIGEYLLNFYNGGVASGGSSGTDYGISFSSSAAAANMVAQPVINVPSPDFFLFFDGGPGVVNIPAGFTDIFSFSYSSSEAGTVNIFDGVDGTGAILASLPIGINFQNVGCPPAFYCNWDVASMPFSGIARSIVFTGNDNNCAYDNMTFGSVSPGPSSVPALSQWGLIILCFSLVAFGGMFIVKKRGTATI
ncbi:MAG: PEP-CTERM sorting domain-containing protein [Bacteroidota bacterium]